MVWESHERGISLVEKVLKLTFSMAYPVWPENDAFPPIVHFEILDLNSQV
jgi:hypothetical protein